MKERAAEQGFKSRTYTMNRRQWRGPMARNGHRKFFLFDGAGNLQYHGAVDDNGEDPAAVEADYLRDAIDAVLAGNSPATKQTPPKGCTIKWKAS